MTRHDRKQQDSRTLAANTASWRNMKKNVCRCGHLQADHHGELVNGEVIALCIHDGCTCPRYRVAT